jgi:hypothetical protein
LRFQNLSETLAHGGIVQPLRVYGMGFLLAAALCSNFACGNSPKFETDIKKGRG